MRRGRITLPDGRLEWGITPSAPLDRMDLAMWNQALAINLTGAFLCSRAALADMYANQWGRIVNVASIAGLQGGAYISAYCASKHGMTGMTRASSSSAPTPEDPGRVDSPPTSMISAPCSTIVRARARAASAEK